MSKQILFDERSRQSLKNGVDKLANAVKITLGPKGAHVVIDKGFGSPMITNDGVTIAKEVELEDKVENVGASLVKEASEKTKELAGDGSTTAVVLAWSMINAGLKNVTAGANALKLKSGMDKAVKFVTDYLEEIKKPVDVNNKTDVANIGTISARDVKIGEMVADIMAKVGKDGVITVEESQSTGLSNEIVEGLEFDRGYVSPYMVTNADRMEAVVDEPYILITDKRISAINELLPILDKIVKTGKKELVIIADDIDGEALATLIVNKLRGILNTVAVKAPGFGDSRKDQLEDIVAVTGGSVITDQLGLKLESTTLEMLGQARRVVITKDNTIIVGGKGEKKNIEARLSQIKIALEKTTSNYDKEKLQERQAKLSGGVAVIKAGAATEVEQKEIQQRIEDAVHATKAAVEEGIVAGGGVALLRAAAQLDKLKVDDEDEKTGVAIIKRALEEPIRQIATNAGLDGAVIAQKAREASDGFGFNAATGQFEDLLKSGVIDPKKVTRIALEKASSIAGMFLTTQAVITDAPEKKEHNHESSMPDMGGDY
ncbi:MAG: chaperonin GroEL [Candidatus Parcubacteria bacterium]|nr:chaperonin GroEL [Candidatus Parcubacteria bacterium]